MFGIGFGELLIIIVVLIIAVGPEQLPSFMRTIGKTIRSMRQASQDLRDSIGLDDFMNRDLLSHRPRPYRRVKPEIDLPQNDPEPIEKDATPKPQESLPEKGSDTPTDSAENTDRSADRAATQVDREEIDKLSGKTGEN